MKNIIRKIAAGVLVAGISVGITYPIAFERGRESAKPVEVTVHQVTGYQNSNQYKFLEKMYVEDAQGVSTLLFERESNKKIINKNFPQDGSLITRLYR